MILPLSARGGGLLYFPTFDAKDDRAAAANPNLAGALLTFYWSEIEPRKGDFNWEELDRRISVWTSSGKKVALRIMWSSNGFWPHPSAKRPTPSWVVDDGAREVLSPHSQTHVPLPWDPIWQRHARHFLAEVARKFDGVPDILFIDVTPGAEGNPYRGRLGQAEPEFEKQFAATPASDGRTYSDPLWLETLQRQIADTRELFKKTPLLVTLNTGGLQSDQFHAIGAFCVSRKMMVGQNGLTGNSYKNASGRTQDFLDWGRQVPLYFEMNHDTRSPAMGSLHQVMEAAQRIGADYLAVYSSDVTKGTPGQPGYDPASEAALAYGAHALSENGRGTMQ